MKNHAQKEPKAPVVPTIKPGHVHQELGRPVGPADPDVLAHGSGTFQHDPMTEADYEGSGQNRNVHDHIAHANLHHTSTVDELIKSRKEE